MFTFTWDGFFIAIAIMMHAILINRGTTKLWPRGTGKLLSQLAPRDIVSYKEEEGRKGD